MRSLLRPLWLQPTSPTLIPRHPRTLLVRRALRTKATTTTDAITEIPEKEQVLEKTKPKRRKIIRPRKRAVDILPPVTEPTHLPKIIITPGSQHHNSLPSYLDYAKRVGLGPTKAVFIGTHYEYVVALSLLRLGFSLLRTGRKHDLGIDLVGHWTLDQFPQQIPVIIQCKARSEGNSCAPMHVRELEGAFRGKPAAWRDVDVLGLLVTTDRASKGILDALGRSPKPMGFLKVSQVGQIEQFVWNRAAGERGLEGVGVQLRYTPRALLRPIGSDAQGIEGEEWKIGTFRKLRNHFSDSGTETDVQLTWMGQPIFPIRKDLAPETMELVVKGIIGLQDAPKEGRQEIKDSYQRVCRTKKEMLLVKETESKISPKVPAKRGRPPGTKNKVKKARPRSSSTSTTASNASVHYATFVAPTLDWRAHNCHSSICGRCAPYSAAVYRASIERSFRRLAPEYIHYAFTLVRDNGFTFTSATETANRKMERDIYHRRQETVRRTQGRVESLMRRLGQMPHGAISRLRARTLNASALSPTVPPTPPTFPSIANYFDSINSDIDSDTHAERTDMSEEVNDHLGDAESDMDIYDYDTHIDW
ncbi:hypothetical protein K504DRAFT_449986 [Pleomassaria siparia CBS 279.74]|uniref:Uncharacterized protein n=1 Tax=Pleomassaria siparia CBS 279.74 TaxID=1314801 RepID=A0A6G1KLA6_9PLEO|nr:hypothetical protein K504DRAFT_449986 [Pleomassaria siparia CBS 279.74]